MSIQNAQVSGGAAKSRADYIWRAIEREQRRAATERDLHILLEQPYDEFDEMHEFVSRRGRPSPD